MFSSYRINFFLWIAGESEPGYLKGARKRAFSLDESIYLPGSVTSVSSDSSHEAKTMSKVQFTS